jgi:hypothetical protein
LTPFLALQRTIAAASLIAWFSKMFPHEFVIIIIAGITADAHTGGIHDRKRHFFTAFMFGEALPAIKSIAFYTIIRCLLMPALENVCKQNRQMPLLLAAMNDPLLIMIKFN